MSLSVLKSIKLPSFRPQTRMSEKKREKSRRKHVYYEGDDDYEAVDDYVDREVSKAMKQMEKAMKQAKLAEKSAYKTYQASSHVPQGVSYVTDKSGKGYKTVNIPGSSKARNVVYVEGCETVNIGCHNNIVINKPRKSSASSQRQQEAESDRRTDRQDFKTSQESKEDRAAAEEMERRKQAVLVSVREVRSADCDIVSQHVGREWRRLLRNLNLDDDLIDQVRADFHADGLRQIIYQGLVTWMRQQGPSRATLGALAMALQRTDNINAILNLQP